MEVNNERVCKMKVFDVWLKDEGRIRRIGSYRSGHWEIVE
jgi:hypothetical protein